MDQIRNWVQTLSDKAAILHSRTSRVLFLCLILACSLFIRWSYITLHNVPVGDEGQYINIAKNVFEGRGYVKKSIDPKHESGILVGTDIMPLYIYSVVLAHKLTGYRHKNAQYVNLIFSFLLTLTVYFLAWRLFKSHSASLLAAFLAGFDPVLTKMATLATKDLSFCLAALFFALLLTYFRPSTLYCLFTGAMLAILILSRRNGYWFVIPLGVWTLINGQGENLKKNTFLFLKIFVVAAVMVSPWYYFTASQGVNEFAFVTKYAKALFQHASSPGGVKPNDDLSINTPPSMFKRTIQFAKNYNANLQRAFRTIIAGSGMLFPVLLFVPFAFIVRPRRPLDFYFGTSFLIFLSILSFSRFPEASLDFYYLPFYPILQIYATGGFTGLLQKHVPKRWFRNMFHLFFIAIVFLPESENIRNHVHPRLKDKNSDISEYKELMEVVNWLNRNLNDGERIAGCSWLRYFLFDLNNRMTMLPVESRRFNADFFMQGQMSWLVVSRNNLRPVESYTARPYLKKYWQEVDGRLEEKNLPAWLKLAYRTESQMVYRIVTLSPEESL